MLDRQRFRVALLLIAGLLLLATAIAVGRLSTEAWRRDLLWVALALYVAAAAALVAGITLSRQLRPRAPGTRTLPRLPWRPAVGALALCLSLAAGVRAGRPLTASQGYGLLALWALALLGFLVATTDLRAVRRRVRACHPWGAEAVRAWAPLAAITLLAGGLRLVDLNGIPYILGGDEANMGWEALLVQNGVSTNPFATGWLSHPTLFFYLQAMALRFWLDPVAGLRLMPALAGTLTVPAVFLLAREILDRRMALVAALYLAGWHYAIHFSRLGLNNIVDPLVAALALYLLLCGLRTAHRTPFALAGLLLGLGQYGYMSARLVPLAAGAYLLWCTIREKGFWRRYRWHVGLLTSGFVVAALPLLLFWLGHRQDFLARVSILGILQSGWLETASETLGRTKMSLLGEQLLKATLGWHYFRDTSPHYAPGRPLLGALDGALFALGLIMAMLPRRPRGAGLLALLFWGVALLGGALLENPPSAPRLLLSTLPVPILLAWALWDVAGALNSLLTWRTAWTVALVWLGVASMTAASVWFYFGTYSPARDYAGANGEVGHRMGMLLRETPAGTRYLFFGAPRMYAGYPTTQYLAPDVEGEDIDPPLTAPLPAPDLSEPSLYIFLPERLAELSWVQASHSVGSLREFLRANGELLFAVYEPD